MHSTSWHSTTCEPRRTLVVLLTCLLGASVAASDDAAVLRVEVSGLRAAKGNVLCALHDSGDTFPKKADKARARARAPASVGSLILVFPDVQTGTYAVVCFHDENGNQDLDQNLLGIPQEGLGFSNDATGTFGPPKFEAAQFRYSGGPQSIPILMHY